MLEAYKGELLFTAKLFQASPGLVVLNHVVEDHWNI
jgi:hypothetical protein